MKIDARTRHSFFPFLSTFVTSIASEFFDPSFSPFLRDVPKSWYLEGGKSRNGTTKLLQLHLRPRFFFSIRRSHSREMVVKIIIFSISSLAYSNRAQCTSICVYISSVRYSIYRCIRCVLDVAKRAYSRKQILKRKKRKRSRR